MYHLISDGAGRSIPFVLSEQRWRADYSWQVLHSSRTCMHLLVITDASSIWHWTTLLPVEYILNVAGALEFNVVRGKCSIGCGAQSWNCSVGFEAGWGSKLHRFGNAVVKHKILPVWSQILVMSFLMQNCLKASRNCLCVNIFKNQGRSITENTLT